MVMAVRCVGGDGYAYVYLIKIFLEHSTITCRFLTIIAYNLGVDLWIGWNGKSPCMGNSRLWPKALSQGEVVLHKRQKTHASILPVSRVVSGFYRVF